MASLMVQRFRGGTSGYTATRADGEGRRALFETQSQDPELTAENTIRHRIKNPVHPDLTFSDDYTMAVNQSDPKAEAKELFVAEAVRTPANEGLTEKRSAVQLEPTGNTLKATGVSEAPVLQQVVPKIRTDLEKPAQVGNAAAFSSHECIKVAQQIMGNLVASYHTTAVLQGPKGEHEEQLKVGGTTSPTVFDVGDLMAEKLERKKPKVTSTKAIHEHVTKMEKKRKGKAEPASSPGYGRLSEEKKKLAARTLGINEFAVPEVGEGFASFTMAERAETEDEEPKHTWGYHYTGVVAKSADRNDVATLENYNRAGDINRTKQELYEKLKRDNTDFLDQKVVELKERLNALTSSPVQDRAAKDEAFATQERIKMLTELEGTAGNWLKEVWLTLKEREGVNRRDAEQSLGQALNAEPTKKWFFHMYSTGKEGQTFHEQQTSSGYFSSPMTLRVRPGG